MIQAPVDPRSPWVIDSRVLGRQPGRMKRLHRQIAAPGDLRIELIGVPPEASIQLDLRLESVVEGVLVSGEVHAPVVGECGRCLTEVTDSVTAQVRELFAYPESMTEQTADADEVNRLAGDLLDLEPVVRDAVVLALPTTPHCREDCRGLCAECGARWDDLPANHTHERTDPRWAELRQLLEEPPRAASEENEE